MSKEKEIKTPEELWEHNKRVSSNWKIAKKIKEGLEKKDFILVYVLRDDVYSIRLKELKGGKKIKWE